MQNLTTEKSSEWENKKRLIKVADEHLCLVWKLLAYTYKNSKHILQNILNAFFILLQKHSLYSLAWLPPRMIWGDAVHLWFNKQ